MENIQHNKCPTCGQTVPNKLFPRELEALVLLCEGYNLKEIAGKLKCSVRTIKNYMLKARLIYNARDNVHLAVNFTKEQFKKDFAKIDNEIKELTI